MRKEERTVTCKQTDGQYACLLVYSIFLLNSAFTCFPGKGDHLFCVCADTCTFVCREIKIIEGMEYMYMLFHLEKNIKLHHFIAQTYISSVLF